MAIQLKPAEQRMLDCRALTVPEQPRAMLEAFDDLAPGQRLRVLSGVALTAALGALQGQRAGAFEWSPLREGPQAWEVEVERRAATTGSRRELTEALSSDHHRLDALEEAAFDARAGGRLQAAGELFASFAHGLRRHIDFEEQLLFPEFESRSGIAGENGPTYVMREEHRAIASILAMMEREVADPEAPVELSRAALRRILHDHDLKEEMVLYPALDRLLDEDESDRMVACIQAWRRG
jgi:uncharacterized protein (DUF2249 family)